ncbi:MAG TPA: NADH-quinone oxidoreductase subunit L [Candidatus Kapabacteria bacterium]|nr:NADH-quinone oxidoreductase subunit L [Candidatus Kapabacteria bacterium]
MDQLILLSLVALGIPLVGFVLIIFNQRALTERAHLIALPAIAFSTVLASYVAWVKLRTHGIAPALEWRTNWIHIGTATGVGPLVIRQSILLDNITVILMVVVTGISLLVHLFSIGYMRQDSRYARYFAFLELFTFAMLGVILAGNFFQLYIFWELVGFTSFILIGHWYERPGPQYAAKKAFITNRIGDALFFIGILLLFSEFRTFDFREIFGLINQGLPLSFSFLGLAPETTLTVAGLLIFAGAVAKSAQFPLFVWLPDAMEGPTPVSALIHAATMVAAGVYLLVRVFPLLTGKAMLIVACTGAFTSFLAATIAITQRDIKRVLAYSTISQLGLMIMAIGAGAVAAGIFHLVTHAAFKALLFLGAGSVIHAMHRALRETHDHETDAQDIHNMGGIFRRMPVTGWTFLIATLAITGLPLTAAFMSKDEILAGGMAYGQLQGGIALAIPWIGFGVTLLTALYMWRIVFVAFFGMSAKPELHEKIRESPMVMTVPLVLLAVFTLGFWFGKNPINPEHGWFLSKWVKTPAQVIPPQTAPPFRPSHYINYPSIPAQAPVFGITIIPPPQAAPAVLPLLPHQVALDEARSANATTAELGALASAVGGFLIALVLFLLRPGWAAGLRKAFAPLYRFSLHGWYIDTIYDYTVADTVTLAARVSAWIDRRIIDGAVNLAGRATVVLARITGAFDKYVVDGLVTLVGATVQFFGLMARSIQTGRIQTYLTWVVAAVVVILLILRFSLFHF